MRTSILIVALLFILTRLCAQQPNLVPNGSFEELDSCRAIARNNRANWYHIGSPDLYSMCFNTEWIDYGVPVNYTGYQLAKHGITYAGIVTSSNPSKIPVLREYLCTMLKDSLRKDVKYNVTFFVNSGNHSGAGTKFQIKVSPDSILNQEPYKPYHYSKALCGSSQLVYDSINWVKISFDFTAKGGEKHLAIGNFEHPDTAIYQQLYPSTTHGNFAYYFIDDISLHEKREAGTATPYVPKPPPVLPPVVPPAVPTLITTTQAGELFVVQNLPPNSQLWVHDAMGRVVYFNNNYDNKLNLSTEAEGMYFYQLRTPVGYYKGKFVVRY